MNKENFNKAVRERLNKVSIKERRNWDGTDLLTWWADAQKEDSSLHCSTVGDNFRQVQSTCKDMYGENIF
jgi:hypothetical protein